MDRWIDRPPHWTQAIILCIKAHRQINNSWKEAGKQSSEGDNRDHLADIFYQPAIETFHKL